MTRWLSRELVEELSRLLLEPLVVVVDDAEQLDGADVSLQVLGDLIRADCPGASRTAGARC